MMTGRRPIEIQACQSPLIETLALTDFRNYRSVKLNLCKRFVVLTGPNGAGKTNLMEAISLLTPGRGMRRSKFDALIRHGSETGWSVFCRVMNDGAETNIGTGLHRTGGALETSRRTKINGATAKTTDLLLDYLRILWLTPAMDGLFTGPAADRRRFIDRLTLTVDPAHGRRARDFERLMRSRNRLLDEGREAAYLDAVETEFSEVAIALSDARTQTLTGLIRTIALQADDGSNFPVADLKLTGEFETENCQKVMDEDGADERSRWYRSRLHANRHRDAAAGRTLFGPHRSDLDVIFAAKSMPAALSSTGEQKALLIGLILAHATLVTETAGQAPILLLDEIAAHLDPDRRIALFDRLEQMGAQTFMTGTDWDLFAALGARAEALSVDNGEIKSSA